MHVKVGSTEHDLVKMPENSLMQQKSFLESLHVKCAPNVIAALLKENSLRQSNAR